MIEIAVKINGDHWINPEAVEQQLQQVPKNSKVMIDMNTEGASMRALGITDMIDRYLAPKQVYVRAWANGVEVIPYHRPETHLWSHFFWLAKRYWHAELLPVTHEKLFGCFIGRATWPRMRMLTDLRREMAERCLFSLMGLAHVPLPVGRNLDPREKWFDSDTDPRATLGDITSLDGHTIRDQYNPIHNTNLSLLAHYHRFDIEIVSETYCYGDAYLPTEKTIRPLLFGKPLLIYGPKYFLKRLRDQGFHTWHDHWNEDYDNLEGPARWQSMLEQIRMISRNDQVNLMLDDCQTISDHNRRHARAIGTTHAAQ